MSELMIPLLTTLLISLGVLAVIYILVKWVLGYITLPAPLGTILNIVVGLIAVILVLRFLMAII